MAGADPAHYAAAFAEIAAQRAGWEEKRAAAAKRAQARRRNGRQWTAADFPRILADVREVLTDPEVPGERKRDAIGHLVEKVYPVAGGARVVFRPGRLGRPLVKLLSLC